MKIKSIMEELILPEQIHKDVSDNPIIKRAFARLKENLNQENHVSHYTKHSSHSTHSKGSW